MTIARQYILVAADDKASALAEALTDLANKIRPLDGCEGVDVMRNLEAPNHFILVERWLSIEAQLAAGKTLGKAAFSAVMSGVVRPPEGCNLEFL